MAKIIQRVKVLARKRTPVIRN